MDNYAIATQKAKERFLTYDREKICAKFRFDADERYIYPIFFGQRCRMEWATGNLERERQGRWVDANSFGEVLTLLDLLCDASETRFLTGKWRSMQEFGLLFHRNLLENTRDRWADRFDREPELLRRGCEALGGRAMKGADVDYAVEIFDGLSIRIQLWFGDEEFAPRLHYLWDENALQYIRYETMYYALDVLHARIVEAGEA